MVVLYCLIIGGAAVWAYLSIARDMNTDPTQCENVGAQNSAFLVLKELDTGNGEFKSWMMVPDFLPGTDRLTVYSVTQALNTNTLEYDYRTILSAQPEETAQQKSEANEPWKEVHVPYTSRPYFYPFESYVSNIRIDFRKGTQKVPLKLQVWNQVGEVVHYPCQNHYSFTEVGGALPNTFSFTLKRHRFVRITAIILYSVAIFFLLYIARREETSKVLTNSLGYIAALWGIRQIITGNTKLFPTLVDILTLALYLTVVSIVIFKWIIVSRFSTEEGQSIDK